MLRALADAIVWLDGAFHGVVQRDGMVIVPLHPQPPIAVSVFEHELPGTMFDIRCALIRDVPISRGLMDFLLNVSIDNSIPEGHLIMRREVADGYCGVELRYCISAELLTSQDALVQLGMRMTGAVESLADYLRDSFGGNLGTNRSGVAFAGYRPDDLDTSVLE
jgi:hypothetical protein